MGEGELDEATEGVFEEAARVVRLALLELLQASGAGDAVVERAVLGGWDQL